MNWLATRLQIDCNGIEQMLTEQTNHREMKTHNSNKNNVKNSSTNRENHNNKKTIEQNYQQKNMAKSTYKWKTQIRMKNRTKENDCNHFPWHILDWQFAINKRLASKINNKTKTNTYIVSAIHDNSTKLRSNQERCQLWIEIYLNDTPMLNYY